MDFKKLDDYMKKANVNAPKLAELTGLTDVGIRGFISKNSCKIGDLEKMTRALGLPMSYWWEEEDALLLNEKKPEYGLRIENEKLKDQLISRLEKDVERLEGEIEWLKQELIRSRDDCEPGQKKKAV